MRRKRLYQVWVGSRGHDNDNGYKLRLFWVWIIRNITSGIYIMGIDECR